MSILIKGMKMPKEQALRIILKNGQLFADHGVCFMEYEAVEVPTPHGRLVDGDNVIDLLREQLTGDRDTVYEYYDDGLEMAISELSIVTTIIEAEEE